MSINSHQPGPSLRPTTSRVLQPLGWLLRTLLPVGVFFLAGIVLIVIAGVAQRTGWIGSTETSSDDSGTSSTDAVFTCPMHPQIRQPSMGRCPICGMELVPAASAAADLDAFSVKIEPAQRRLANIQTSPVEAGPLEKTLEVVGDIAIDESRQATIAAYIDGRLERLFADYTGVDISKGDHLAVIYSPQLFAAQVDYVESRRALDTPGGLPVVRLAQETLAKNARQRLREYGMTEEQVAELERTGEAQSRLTIYSPQGGTVVEKLAIEGNYVKAGEPIYRIAELSTVWLLLKVFPEDAAQIRFGQRVEATVQSLPGTPLVGRVAFVDPVVDPQTRTVAVRVELLNEDKRLRPGDYAQVKVVLPIGPLGEVYDADLAKKWISPMHPQIIRDQEGKCPICGMDLVPTSRYGFADEPVPQAQSLYVPRSAVLLAGGNSVVYVETEPGEFQIRLVTIGSILRDRVVVLNGLNVGEMVATAGNFLIDSQMQLAGKPSLIDVSKLRERAEPQERPLRFEGVSTIAITGEAGRLLETLYAHYFEVHDALAADRKPTADSATGLHRAAVQLLEEKMLPRALAHKLQAIADHAAHLHHKDLKDARGDFKPISHAILAIASQARGDASTKSFAHFYCPMVEGGGGDWLQAEGDLLNPYYGSEMLHCGEKVRDILPSTKPSPPEGDPHHHSQPGEERH